MVRDDFWQDHCQLAFGFSFPAACGAFSKCGYEVIVADLLVVAIAVDLGVIPGHQAIFLPGVRA